MKYALAILVATLPCVAFTQIADELIPQLPAAAAAADPFADLNTPKNQTSGGRLLPDEQALRREPIPPREQLVREAEAAPPSPENGQQQTPPIQSSASSEPSRSNAASAPTEASKAPEDELVSPAVQAVEARLPKISNEDLAALNPVIPEAPTWLVTQQRLDVQFYVHKRALERESELTKIRADIAENEKRVRAALTEADAGGASRNGRPALSFGPAPNNIDPNNFEQLASLAGFVRASDPPAAAPPPPPPPKLIAIAGSQATLEINGIRQTMFVGQRAGDYQLSRVGFGDVDLSNRGSTITLSLEW